MLYKFLYRRKRKDRWWRFLVLKSAFVQAGGKPTSGQSWEQCLRGAFKRFGYPVPPSPISSFWEALVRKGAANCPELAVVDLAEIQSQAEELDSSLLPSMCWLDLFRLCIGLGFFQTARVLREKALDRMIVDASGQHANLGQVTIGCYAEVERRRFVEARDMLGRMEQLQCPEHRVTQVRWFISLMSGEPDNVYAEKAWASTRDPAFREAINGQRIALVGPVATESSHGGEIDGHDVVVKFGYRGGDQGCDPCTQGERVDIAYYNNTQAKALAESGYAAVFSDIRWGVCNNRKGTSWFSGTLQNLRLLTSLQWFLPDTHLNAGPNATIDMLRFKPDEIRVFNTDMMLSSGRFAGYRVPNDKPTDYTRSFIKTHDPILQYQIMRRLWTCGYIHGDQRFEEVMRMGLVGYLEELQKAYGADTHALL